MSAVMPYSTAARPAEADLRAIKDAVRSELWDEGTDHELRNTLRQAVIDYDSGYTVNQCISRAINRVVPGRVR